MYTGENGRSIRQLMNMIRGAGIVVLLLHFYFYAYAGFGSWGLTCPLSERILENIARTGLFNHFMTSKLIPPGILALSLLGAPESTENFIRRRRILFPFGIGVCLYFGSVVCFFIFDDPGLLTFCYVGLTSAGFIKLLMAGNLWARALSQRWNKDIFNKLHQSFPQEERCLTNPYSINLPARYNLKGEIRNSFVNVVNPFRGCLLVGNPGSSKTVSFVEPFIKQHIQKGFSMLVYDFKFDDLSKMAYNHYLDHTKAYCGKGAFYCINFDDLRKSHRCNPLGTGTMSDITDAEEAATTILLGLNMDWVSKRGEFFVESAITFVTSLIWYLYQYQGGKYCSWPHVIELAQVPYKDLFTVLRTEPQIEARINPFIKALADRAIEQLAGQIGTATISLAKLSVPGLYYVLTGNDFTLDLNNPEKPAILCLGNNPRKSTVYGAILSVYINTANRLVNRKGDWPFSEVVDEGASITIISLDKLLATGRSNLISVLLTVQNLAQLRLAYGESYADVLFELCGNLFCGQVGGETAKVMSERFDHTLQARETISTSELDTGGSVTDHLEQSIPASRIASLSSGEFVGMVADTPEQPIDLKAFWCKIPTDFKALNEERRNYKELPTVNNVTEKEVMANFLQVKRDIKELIEAEITGIRETAVMRHLVIE